MPHGKGRCVAAKAWPARYTPSHLHHASSLSSVSRPSSCPCPHFPRFHPAACRLVDLRVNVQALPLQALSMAVLPLPWTLPRLLSIQLAVPSAVTEGEHAAGDQKNDVTERERPDGS